MGRQHLSERQWRELVARQRRSGLGVAAFCAEAGVAASTFFAWRRRLRDETEPAFVEVVPQRTNAAAPGAASSMMDDMPGDGAIELLLASGVKVRVREGFDAQLLRQVVEALS